MSREPRLKTTVGLPVPTGDGMETTAQTHFSTQDLKTTVNVSHTESAGVEAARLSERAAIAALHELHVEDDLVDIKATRHRMKLAPDDLYATHSAVVTDPIRGRHYAQHKMDPRGRLHGASAYTRNTSRAWHDYAIGMDVDISNGLGMLSIAHYFGERKVTYDPMRTFIPSNDDDDTNAPGHYEGLMLDQIPLSVMRAIRDSAADTVEMMEEYLRTSTAPLAVAIAAEDGEGDD